MKEKEVKECFSNALKEEQKGKKHKGLLIVKPDDAQAKGFLIKAKANLELCDLYKQKGFDYKIPEEWFYTLYYCGLAILSKFGVETRSQRCTAAFLRAVKDKGAIDYDDEFIDRITVYKEKNEISDVDEREHARYSSLIKMEEVEAVYKNMTDVCKRAISQCEEIVYSEKKFVIPKDLI
ncbi:hypothetical protein J4464_06355 [Candidatus Woesearchaeota archaeon]|nr:hypothetical protein [Candidatus Woesearchaeota archaeon]